MLASHPIAHGLIAGSIYALIAIGFVVIYRTVQFFHIAHGAVYAVGAYVAFSIVRQLGWHPMIGFFLPWSQRALSGWRLTGASIGLSGDGGRPTSST